MRTKPPLDRALKMLAPAGRATSWYDEARDEHVLKLVMTGPEVAEMAFPDGGEGVVRSMARHVDGFVATRVAAARYDSRPRPRLGAGTVGYARRRR